MMTIDGPTIFNCLVRKLSFRRKKWDKTNWQRSGAQWFHSAKHVCLPSKSNNEAVKQINAALWDFSPFVSWPLLLSLPRILNRIRYPDQPHGLLDSLEYRGFWQVDVWGSYWQYFSGLPSLVLNIQLANHILWQHSYLFWSELDFKSSILLLY